MEIEKPKSKQKKKKERSEPITIVSTKRYDDPVSNLSQSADISRELQNAALESYDERRFHYPVESAGSSITSDNIDIEKISLEGSYKSFEGRVNVRDDGSLDDKTSLGGLSLEDSCIENTNLGDASSLEINHGDNHGVIHVKNTNPGDFSKLEGNTEALGDEQQDEQMETAIETELSDDFVSFVNGSEIIKDGIKCGTIEGEIKESANKTDNVTETEEHFNVQAKSESPREIIEANAPPAPAPLTEHSNIFNELLLENQKIVNTIQMESNEFIESQENGIGVKTSSAVKFFEDSPKMMQLPQIRAYTEAQLAAFYSNSELESVEQFSQEFVEAELKGLASKQHPLHELLVNYLHARSKVTGNTLEVEQLRKEYKDSMNLLWSLDSAVISASVECQDGNKVTAYQSYTKATFHRSTYQTVTRIMNDIRKLSNESHTLHSYSAEVLRLQIEVYIQTVIKNCMTVSQLPLNASVNLTLQNAPPHMVPYLSDLRLCISVLFLFQRRLVKDVDFIKMTRDWLSRLVAVLLRMANWQDHMFLLNHILRCPPGVGSWATGFIQAPLDEKIQDSPFSNYQVNHIIATLSVILMPACEREKFLQDLSQNSETPGETLWVVVDSEGEEDEDSSGTALRENDLVSFLNQLPLDNLFRALLLVQRRNDEDLYDIHQVSEHHIMRFLSFSTVLLKILRKGLMTYDQPRYNQFSKRLCRFIRHIVQYATDQWEIFKNSQQLDDAAMLERLQVEYDAFFLRATYYLYTSKKMGAWQFLAIVPYGVVSIKTILKIYYFLHDSNNEAEVILNPVDETNYFEKIWEHSLRSLFEDNLVILEDGECYYLLNTFANMALARGDEDMDFIRLATMDLMQVGFVSEATQETCSKNARILLTHISSKHPHLLSHILKSVKDNMTLIGSLCLYLYEELPLTVWRLLDEDLDIISRWLLHHPLSSNESQLARMIISRLNWDFVEEGLLFLPFSMHLKVALLAMQAVDKDPGYTPWAWKTLFRLRLHINDKGHTDFFKIQEPANFDILSKGLREQQPLSGFLSLLMTSWGHLVPLICSKGLCQVNVLLVNQKYEAAIFALNLIVPLFIECQESLINNEQFQFILQGLLNADRGYVNMAKSLVVFQNTVLEQFGHMIEYQICNFLWYNLGTPRCIVRLWINSLVSVPNWNKDYGVMQLLDVIIRAAFFHADAIDAANNILKDLLQCATPQEQSNSISSLFKWVSQSNAQGNNLLINSSLSSCSWLAYVMINLEYEEREKQTGLWKEVLVQLRNQKGKVNVDAAIKKAASTLKVPSFTSGALCIFRWAQQALDTPIDHPLLALLWQKFFCLYLCRVPVSGVVDVGCVGAKFFEGLINLGFMKRLKKRLQETVDYFKEKIDSDELEDDPQTKLFFENTHKLYRAFSLWLEEPRLQEASLFLPGLPPQYEPQLLSLIIQGSTAPWVEYVNYDLTKEHQQKAIKAFKSANFREKSKMNLPLLNPGSNVESNDPIVRILRRLGSYDSPKPPPHISKAAPILPALNLSDKDAMFRTLDQFFKTLFQYAHDYGVRVSEHNAIDCTYLELVPQLYRTVVQKIKKQVTCKGTKETVHCSGPGVVTLQIQDARINERIDHQIQANRAEFESKLTKIMQAPAHNLCMASVVLQYTIGLLQSHLQTTQLPTNPQIQSNLQAQTNPAISEMGVELFYYILQAINDETSNYLPTKQLFTDCLEKLGQSHICGFEYETPRLLNKILAEPSLGVYLAPHFSPVNVGTANFLLMYSTISKDVGERYDVVFALLSKFDVSKWLRTHQPKLSQRSQFIDLVIKALTKIGHEPPKDSLMLHGVYRKHLLSVFEHQFPEHFGEILMSVLKSSNAGIDTGCVAVAVWMDLLNFLAKPIVFKLNTPMRDHLRRYAQQQRLLQYQELLETATLLARHFTQERFQYGLYGLYPKTRIYIEVFLLFIGMTGHALIISSLNTHQGLLGDKLCEIIWPFLRDMFSPWVLPYMMNNLKDNMANWIQQLADDRAVLLPWIPADGPFAQKAVHMFFECIQFLIQTLPACNNILSYIWQWYVTNFAYTSVKDHILNVIHSSFLALPWQNFWPTVADLELMLKVVEQYLPECHVFLGYIFIEVNWTGWLASLSDSTPQPIKARVHQCILYLLVKLSNEPNIRNNHVDKAKSLLVQAEGYNWSLIDPSILQQIMDWYVMSCDPLVIFKSDPMNLDFRVLHFLRCVAGYDRPLSTNSIDILKKRHIFARGYGRLFSVFTNKHKSLIPSKEQELCNVISAQLNHMEKIVHTPEEFNVMLSTYFEILNLRPIVGVATKSFEYWIVGKPGDSLVISSVLQTLSSAVCDQEAAATLFETALNTYFVNNVSQNDSISWKNVSELIVPNHMKQKELEQTLVARGGFLTLHAFLLKRVSNCNDFGALLNICLDWLGNIKISESVEPKVPLLWSDLLSVSSKYCEIDEPCAGVVLYKFAQTLLQVSEEKESSKWGRGLLGAIGIVKQVSITMNFKFLCRAVAGYVLAQLPEMKGNPQVVRRTSDAPNAVGTSGGNVECAKWLLKLDFGQSQGKIKEYAELALKQIQDSRNSLHNVNKFLHLMVTQIYLKPYLKDIG